MAETIKQRRRSGYVTPHLTVHCSREFLNWWGIDPQPYWDDWVDWRDGLRDWFGDNKKIKKLSPHQGLCYDNMFKRLYYNQKNKQREKIRKARKIKRYK